MVRWAELARRLESEVSTLHVADHYDNPMSCGPLLMAAASLLLRSGGRLRATATYGVGLALKGSGHYRLDDAVWRGDAGVWRRGWLEQIEL